jgi:hypothetical protein
MLEHMGGIDQVHRPTRHEGKILHRSAMVDMREIQRVDMKPAGDVLNAAAKVEFLDVRSTHVPSCQKTQL